MTHLEIQAEFDVFISYRWVSPDQQWVREELFTALQAAGLRVLLDVEDFVPGRDLILEMMRAGRSSRTVLCVISPDYFEGNRMVAFEALAARRGDPSGLESKLVPLILRKANLPDWIRGLVPLDWTDPAQHAREWRKLLKVLNAPYLDVAPPSQLEVSSSPHEENPRRDAVASPPYTAIRVTPARRPKRYNEDQRRTYAGLWQAVLKLVDLPARNGAQVTFEDRAKGAAHHNELAEPGYEVIRLVDRLAPMLEPEHYARVREFATAYCNYHVDRRMEYTNDDCSAPGKWTTARGSIWKRLFFDDRIELEAIFREVLTSGE